MSKYYLDQSLFSDTRPMSTSKLEKRGFGERVQIRGKKYSNIKNISANCNLS